jgi:hypothetical protein
MKRPFYYLISLFLGLLFQNTAVAGNTAKTIWRTTLPEAGQSGICVHGDNVYLTIHAPIQSDQKGMPKGKDVIGQCYSRADGKLKWEVQLPGNVEGSMLEAWHDATSLFPVANEERVIFQNLSGMVLSCDHDGKVLWTRPFEAPSPDIKNSRMYLLGNTLIVALPSDELAVKAKGKYGDLPFYRMHGIDAKTGKDLWVSPVAQSHATQYSLVEWNGKPAIATSLIELSHWKFNRGNHAYFLSVKDGTPIHKFTIPKCNPHQKSQILDNNYLITHSTKGKTHFQLISPKDGSVTSDIQYALPEQYYGRVGEKYELQEWNPKFESKGLAGRRYPTHSTMHSYGNKIYYFASASPSIGCYDLATKKATMVDVPVQVLGCREIWDVKNLEFDPGVRNVKGKVVYSRSAGSGRGPHWGGFGHMNPAWPIKVGNTLYWQGGLGVLYRINLEGDFSPDKVSWAGISPEGGHWSFGAPAVVGNEVYIRSQLELVRLEWE